jgi:uncharacterized delta-60 repeat protein
MKTRSLAPALLAICFALRVHAAPGDLDLSFGGTGTVMLIPGQGSQGSAIAAYPDGKLIVAGTVNGNFAVLRLNENGSLDETFNGSGSASASLGGGVSYCTCMALGPNGQIVAAGYFGGASFGVAGFDEDGFNTFKTVTPSIGTAESVAIQANGKIVVVGSNGNGFWVVRYDAGGVLDNSFDSDGMAPFGFGYGSNAYGIAVQPDGRIVVVGKTNPTQNSVDVLVMRLNPNGSLDGTFGGTGYVAIPVTTGADYGRDVALMPDGRIVVAGYATIPMPEALHGIVLRLNTDGSLDSSFDEDGKVITSGDSTAKIALQADGKILYKKTGTLFRLNADGSGDDTFTGQSVDNYSLEDVAVQSDGRIVTAGSKAGIMAARYHAVYSLGLVVEQPPGSSLTSGAAQPIDFGTVIPGQNSSITFTLRNRGTGDNLTGIAVTKAATGTPEDFTISPLEGTTLAPGASSDFNVTFSPSTSGTRTARLEISSNDPDYNPFIVNLTGWGATNSDVWRKTHFGSFSNVGPGADLNDPDNDGLLNLLEFAIGGNPLLPTPSIGQLNKTDSGLEFTYSRPNAAVGEVTYELESSATMSGNWIRTGTTTTIVSDDGITQLVKVTTSAGSFGKRFVRLRVNRP